MSLATNQQMTLLATIGGCLFRMHEDSMFSVVTMKELVDKTYLQIIGIMKAWPETGDLKKNMLWMNDKIDKWEVFLREAGGFHKLTVLTCICQRGLADLQSQLNSTYKLRLIAELNEPLDKIHGFMDPDCVNFPAYEKADELMNNLYELIKWEWKK